jgi:class 3 adenylate cyclase/tetratricopeptide (TPR) repeat protein
VPDCASCGQENPEIARFCLACGSALAERPQAREERKVVTVLFADLAGSTRLGEKLDPERLKEVMGAWYEAMRAEIEAEGGTVEKFIGDAVMAAFGVPAAHEDDPERALRAALAMRERLAALNGQLAAEHGVELAMRIGVNTGEVVAVTEPRPGEPMATGDAVNAAARLQAAAEPGSILAAERTARAARGVRFEQVRELRIAGREAPLTAFAVVGSGPRPERGVPGLHAPLVGRDRELAVLQALHERVAAERRPHLVTVYGDPGIGKSRLVREFLRAAEAGEPAPRVLFGRCLPYGDGVAYWPLAEMLKAVAGIRDSDTADTVLDRIRATGGELLGGGLVADPLKAAAALAYTVGIDDPDGDLSRLSPRQVRVETHAAWRAFFSALAAAGPVVAVVEDIHWAGGELLDLLEGLAARVEGPLLFLCPARPELTGTRPTWGGGSRSFSSIVLEPLEADDARALVGHLLAVEGLPDDTRARILSRAEGNPFFLEEILHQLIDAGSLVRRAGVWHAAEGIERVALPDTVQAVLAARIDLLGPDEKRVLQRASVVGRVFWTGSVRALLDGQAGSLDGALRVLEERELVIPRLGSAFADQDEFVFKHVLTRDVAYESLPRRERAAAHAVVADWIEGSAGDRRGEFVDLLAFHYNEAHRTAAHDRALGPDRIEELRVRAFGALHDASRAANRKASFGRARRLAEQALDLARAPLERVQALEALGDGYFGESIGDDAWRSYTEAIDIRVAELPDDGEAIALLCGRALQTPLRWTGTMRRVPPEEDTALYLRIGTENASDGDGEALSLLLAAQAFWSHGYPHADVRPGAEVALAAGERAVEVAARIGRPDLAVAGLDAVQNVFTQRGDYGHAREVADRRLALARTAGDAWELGDTYAMAAWAAFHSGLYRHALELAREGYEAVVDEAPLTAAHCVSWRSLARFKLGDWDGALADLALEQEILGERRDRPVSGLARPWPVAAFVHEARGERSVADRLLESVSAIEDDREGELLPHLAIPVALVLVLRGAYTEARARLEAPAANRNDAGMGLQARAELAIAAGAWEEASELGRALRDEAVSADVSGLSPCADRLEGEAALAAGDLDRAHALLGRAADDLAALGAAVDAASAAVSLAAVLGALGETPAARRRLEPALAELDRLGYLRELERARTVAEELPQG